MNQTDRHLKVFADGEPFAPDNRFRLSGTVRIGLFPSLFLLQCWNLSDSDIYRLQNTKDLSVMREDSCLAFGQVSDVYVRTVPEGTVTTAAFSLGLELWENPPGSIRSRTDLLSWGGGRVQIFDLGNTSPATAVHCCKRSAARMGNSDRERTGSGE